MRELGVLENEQTPEMAASQKMEALAAQCTFANCDHDKSAGCAVIEALETGELSERELRNYRKLAREREFSTNKGATNAARHSAQNKKRENQKNEATRRARLSRGK